MHQINLLPKTKQEEFKYETILHSLIILIILSLLSFAAVFFTQTVVRLYLKNQVTVISGEITESQQQVNRTENASLKSQIQTLNNTISDYQTLAQSAPKWSKVIKAFAPLPPAGLQIASLTIDVGKKQMTITGTAPTRELVIQLYNNILQDSQEFYNIDYPLENVARPTNITFHYTFSIRDVLIH